MPLCAFSKKDAKKRENAGKDLMVRLFEVAAVYTARGYYANRVVALEDRVLQAGCSKQASKKRISNRTQPNPHRIQNKHCVAFLHVGETLNQLSAVTEARFRRRAAKRD
jgi:hypothetical protein